jgi:hypothetical protein
MPPIKIIIKTKKLDMSKEIKVRYLDKIRRINSHFKVKTVAVFKKLNQMSFKIQNSENGNNLSNSTKFQLKNSKFKCLIYIHSYLKMMQHQIRNR